MDAWGQAHKSLAPNPWAHDPVGWAREKLGEFFWSKQREILASVTENRYTAVQSCHGVGKSFGTSRAIAWWLDTKPQGDAFAVTTAPTAAQVSAILWREVRRAHKKGKLGGYITGGTIPEWKMSDGEPIGYGRKPADHDQSAFQGIHARHLLVAIDEAGGVPKSIFDAADSLATNEYARVVAIGNPDDPSSHFAKICRPGSGWNVIRIDALASPLFTEAECRKYPELYKLMQEEGIPFSTEEIPEDLVPMLVSPMWVWERIKRWGIASPIFTAKVRGLFPDIGEDILISPRLIREAQQRWEDAAIGNWKVLGVDVARFGSDRTVIGMRSGIKFHVIEDHGGLDTVQVAKRVMAVARGQRVDEIRVDGVGVGAGVVDRINEDGVDVVDMQSGGGAIEDDLFLNARAEWWWGVKDRFENALIAIDPEDDDLAAQLGSMKYDYGDNGKIKVESKKSMKARGLPSPDRADTLMLTSPVAEQPGAYQDEQIASYGISSV